MEKELKDSGLLDRTRIKNKTRVEILLYKHQYREKSTEPGTYKSILIPDLEIHIGDTGLSFRDRGNLYYFAHDINAIERILEFGLTIWKREKKKGIEIPFSMYIKAANGRSDEAA
ncbi:hypothetical protein [Leptospira sanjuanensis]|uniref:hypothetical protein n=1 Tax=Leptospira sanjuanensis TaxID=2879643 RepID=UPI001EE8F149|nr:hypothetical protein [Leptospira sanjuanensis]MCG6170261.1 hypothetical protein [Leptospira sanjuanensis]